MKVQELALRHKIVDRSHLMYSTIVVFERGNDE